MQGFPEPGSSFLPRHFAPSRAWDTISTHTLSDGFLHKNASRLKTNKKNQSSMKILSTPSSCWEVTVWLSLPQDQALTHMEPEIQLRKACNLQWGTPVYSASVKIWSFTIISICISSSEVSCMSPTLLLNIFLEHVSWGQNYHSFKYLVLVLNEVLWPEWIAYIRKNNYGLLQYIGYLSHT